MDFSHVNVSSTIFNTQLMHSECIGTNRYNIIHVCVYFSLKHMDVYVIGSAKTCQILPF